MRRFFILVFFFLPLSALAAPFLGPIVPECANGGICGACDLVKLADNLLRFMVAFSVFVAAIMFAYAGFLYVTASASKSNLETAKKIFWNVFLGFIFILTAWLIIDLSLRVLTGSDLNALTQIQCADIGGAAPGSQQGSGQQPGGGVQPGGGAGGGGQGTATPGTNGTMTHNAALQELTSNGIVVTSTAGSSGVSGTCSGTGCTNLTGMRADTVNQIVEFKRACGCAVTITGGTEQGPHDDTLNYTHVAGYKVDIDDNNAVTNLYIRRTFTPVSGSTVRYVDGCGNQYLNHDSHWDITVKQACTYGP